MILPTVTNLQVELTSNCNAMCPGCGRNIDGLQVNPNLVVGTKGNMSKELWQKIVYNNWENLNYIDLDGNWGDSILHPYSVEMLDEFGAHLVTLERDNKPILDINSNMGYHSTDRWRKLANVIKKYYRKNSIVQAGLDGVDNESHQKYRKLVDFDKAIENCKALIDEGINVKWKFIEFDHNEHLVEEAMSMAKQLGFSEFEKKTTRANSTFIHQKFDKKPEVIVNKIVEKKPDKTKQIKVDTYKGIGKTKTKELETKWKKVEKKDFSNIKCKWQEPNLKIQIEYNGRLHQCCFLSGYYNFNTENTNNTYYNHYYNKYNSDWNDVNTYSIEEILNHRFFQKDLIESWSNTTDSKNNPLMVRCQTKCSVAATKIS